MRAAVLKAKRSQHTSLKFVEATEIFLVVFAVLHRSLPIHSSYFLK